MIAAINIEPHCDQVRLGVLDPKDRVMTVFKDESIGKYWIVVLVDNISGDTVSSRRADWPPRGESAQIVMIEMPKRYCPLSSTCLSIAEKRVWEPMRRSSVYLS